jgi:hypothetical protein
LSLCQMFWVWQNDPNNLKAFFKGRKSLGQIVILSWQFKSLTVAVIHTTYILLINLNFKWQNDPNSILSQCYQRFAFGSSLTKFW